MHLRRALILFAVVLGLAALAGALSQPRREADRQPADAPAPRTKPEQPTLVPGEEASRGTQLRFGGEEPRTRRLQAGRTAVASVAVGEPGQVAIPDLGLIAPADPLTPARFDLLVTTPGRYPVRFTPAGEAAAETVGTLLVVGSR
jgi:hypothetical protein